MIKTSDVNPTLEKTIKLTVVSTKDIDTNATTAKEDKEKIESRKPKQAVSTADIDWKKREQLKKLAQARLANALKRKEKKK